MENIENIRHSLAHLMAQAVLEFWPKTKLGMGPAIENGFYYDFQFAKPLQPADLKKIEEKMRELILQDQKFIKKNITKLAAKKLFKSQPYKLELMKELPGKSVSIYTISSKDVRHPTSGGMSDIPPAFTDLCKGPHVRTTKEINPKAFKLTKIAGAYWKGDEKNKMLTRIYGLAFLTEKELQNYIKMQEEAEKRDHRVLGQKMELFLIDEKIGQGLPIWLPNGAITRKIIENYLYDELSKSDYKWLYTPHIGSRKLWETSGHWNFYSENMYPVLEVGQSLQEAQKGKKTKIKEEYLLKPMNCPFHAAVYNSKIRSYKNLPIKFAELGTVYRYERSGTLHGLVRVRGFTQDDAHLICTKEQMPKELEKLIRHGLKMLKDFGFEHFNIYLATKPKKYAGSPFQWEKSTETLKQILKNLKLEYKIDEGGGVFYGPKIDIKIKDALNREWQCTTVQFDFNLPARFKMKYINEKGEKEEPYMIHRALLGSMERFFGVLLEHYAGALPLWLAPMQVAIISISQKHDAYAKEIQKQLAQNNIRCESKNENETLGKKIREAEMQKIPYLLIVGDKEIQTKTVSIRERGKGAAGSLPVGKFIDDIKGKIENKAI